MQVKIVQWLLTMEEDFNEKIKNVFDVCDSDRTGFISVDHLKDLARDHFGADSDEETIGIIHLLDPEAKGKVNFQDFRKGVQQILEVQAQSKHSTPTNTGNYTEFIQSINNSYTALSPGNEVQDTSEASAFTFNEYDTNTDEDAGQLLIDFSTPETSRRHLFPAHNSGRSSVNSKTDEENYEDFGVGHDLESDSSDANISCDSCQKARRLNLNTRQHRHKGPHRRISSAAYATQLTRAVRSPFSPVEDIYDDIDGSFQEMNDRIKYLEKQLVKVADERGSEQTIKSRFKDENSILIKSVVDRIHTLEEQLKDVEVKSDDQIKDERRKIQDMVNKHEADEDKLDYLTVRLHTVETENETLKANAVRLKLENDRLKMDRLDMSDRLSAVEEDYNHVSADYEEMLKKGDRERLVTGQLLDELQKELDDLRKYKIEAERKHPLRMIRNPSLSDSTNGYGSLQKEMAKLKEANRHLAEENEDLNAQLLAVGRNILQGGSSLAEELDHMTKEELMTALKEQQDQNFRLSQYVDKILLTILEKNPSMLEVH